MDLNQNIKQLKKIKKNFIQNNLSNQNNLLDTSEKLLFTENLAEMNLQILLTIEKLLQKLSKNKKKSLLIKETKLNFLNQGNNSKQVQLANNGLWKKIQQINQIILSQFDDKKNDQFLLNKTLGFENKLLKHEIVQNQEDSIENPIHFHYQELLSGENIFDNQKSIQIQIKNFQLKKNNN
ncbi:hypothetical protein M0811_11406 [Anaeramoeba ignava]|uniref:Uncharacterized protein n=1 Tax=Anaeramoeba ignava TaxID=1746090 RepID=A0A9Q0R7D2_ANAIG|nr:hypothetical protein M0811_11406 [Anaeramoeba ignava]